MNYGDFSGMFRHQAYQFGRGGDEVWGYCVWQPQLEKSQSTAAFFLPNNVFLSGEVFELSGPWVFNTGFTQPDGSLVSIETVSEILSDPTGSHALPASRAQHYALWDIPDYEYSIWTHGRFIYNGKVVGEFSHSQFRMPPACKANPYWQGEGDCTRLAVEQHEVWEDDGGGVWSVKHDRRCWAALDLGTIWYVEDDLHGVSFGMRQAWQY